ncbi:hypothetical protein [Trinickia acidisoli]|uniref:hypothetical protein n=1 Tax=Trinickia acidisoli TaxID=2767482 RepID=UPI001A907C81|nr:hypothetical protein [Trinickia acidisoli]
MGWLIFRQTRKRELSMICCKSWIVGGAIGVAALAVARLFFLRKRLLARFVDIEKWLEGVALRLWGCIKRIAHFEFSTLTFTVAILVLAGITCIILRIFYNREDLHGLQEYTEVASSILNFLGVMLVAQGVILLNKDKINLKFHAIKGGVRFSRLVARLFVDASACCEKGSMFVVIAFVLDMVAKFVF